MAVESSPEFACGQIMFGIKMSKLNYMVKETPYSVYVTIRKRFMREQVESYNRDNNSRPFLDTIKSSDKDTELINVKQWNKDIETRLALAVVEHEELELKLEKHGQCISKYENDIENHLNQPSIEQFLFSLFSNSTKVKNRESKSCQNKKWDNLKISLFHIFHFYVGC